MIRRPPRSTLFPTRRSSDLGETLPMHSHPANVVYSLAAAKAKRSEEHTSELQSLTNLVCRLLLEKKKKTSKRSTTADKQNTHIEKVEKHRRTSHYSSLVDDE